MIHVRTFGSPTTFSEMGCRSQKHLASTRDPVSWIFNPIACAKALFFPDSSPLQLLPSEGGFFDHSFNGATYQKGMSKELDYLISK